MSKLLIRSETPEDREVIRGINEAAFETPAEADLVDALREKADPIISLVAEENHRVVGHILFSPVTLPGEPSLKFMGLAPMAVSPEYQQQGIGSKLVPHGLERCRELGVAGVVVLGHPEFYPRFGFVPASQFQISSEYEVPDDAFMMIQLSPHSLKNYRGTVHYHAAFADL